MGRKYEEDWIGFSVATDVEEARMIAAERCGVAPEAIEIETDGASVRARPRLGAGKGSSDGAEDLSVLLRGDGS